MYEMGGDAARGGGGGQRNALKYSIYQTHLKIDTSMHPHK